MHREEALAAQRASGLPELISRSEMRAFLQRHWELRDEPEMAQARVQQLHALHRGGGASQEGN